MELLRFMKACKTPFLLTAVALLGAVLLRPELAGTVHLWGHVVVVGGLLGLVWWKLDLDQVFDPLPSAAKGVMWLFLGGALWGQFMKAPEATFPFPSWHMYAISEPFPLRVVEYTFALPSGEIAPVRLADLIPANVRATKRTLDLLCRDVVQGDDPEGDRLELLNRTLEGMAANRQSPERPLASGQIWVLTWNYGPGNRIVPSERRLLHHYEFVQAE